MQVYTEEVPLLKDGIIENLHLLLILNKAELIENLSALDN